MFTELFFSHTFKTNKVNFHAKFNAYTLLPFMRYRSLKMALRARPISYRVFRESGPRKAITKISNLKFTELFFSYNFNMNKVSLHAKFHVYTLRFFKIQIGKTGFTGTRFSKDPESHNKNLKPKVYRAVLFTYF